MRTHKLEFTTLPDWVFPKDTDRNIYSLAAALTLVELENRWIKLSADTQRRLVGDTRFGKQSIGLFDGELVSRRKVCFGLDSEITFIRPADHLENRHAD